MSKPCAVDHCPWPSVCHGMCSTHYQRWRSRGSTDKSSLAEGRFWAENQGNELTQTIPRATMIAVVRTLAAHDALDLAPMLLAPANGPRR